MDDETGGYCFVAGVTHSWRCRQPAHDPQAHFLRVVPSDSLFCLVGGMGEASLERGPSCVQLRVYVYVRAYAASTARNLERPIKGSSDGHLKNENDGGSTLLFPFVAVLYAFRPSAGPSTASPLGLLFLLHPVTVFFSRMHVRDTLAWCVWWAFGRPPPTRA